MNDDYKISLMAHDPVQDLAWWDQNYGKTRWMILRNMFEDCSIDRYSNKQSMARIRRVSRLIENVCNQTTVFSPFFLLLCCLVHYPPGFSSHQTVPLGFGGSRLHTSKQLSCAPCFLFSIEILWYSSSSFCFSCGVHIAKRDQCACVCLIKHNLYHSMILCFCSSLVSLSRERCHKRRKRRSLFWVWSSTRWDIQGMTCLLKKLRCVHRTLGSGPSLNQRLSPYLHSPIPNVFSN